MLAENIAATWVLDLCDRLAACTDEAGGITRLFLSPATHRAHEVLSGAMREAGMDVTIDAIGNVLGRFPGVDRGAPRVLIGSHLDTVRNAGRYDGILGVALGVAVARELGYGLDVIAFSEEEGVRFGVPFLGSRAVVGDLPQTMLGLCDAEGISVHEAISNFGLDPSKLTECVLDPELYSCYLEPHIEQGPVLDDAGQSLAVVAGIVAQRKLAIRISGQAGHAGTVPLPRRRDPVAGAAEMICAIEAFARDHAPYLATVGRISAHPGVTNTIAQSADFTIDCRHPETAHCMALTNGLLHALEVIAVARKLGFSIISDAAQPALACHPGVQESLGSAVGGSPVVLTSGAGHDAMVVASRIPVGMLFLRCKDGVSHHPDEHVRQEDVAAAIAAMSAFVLNRQGK